MPGLGLGCKTQITRAREPGNLHFLCTGCTSVQSIHFSGLSFSTFFQVTGPRCSSWRLFPCSYILVLLGTLVRALLCPSLMSVLSFPSLCFVLFTKRFSFLIPVTFHSLVLSLFSPTGFVSHLSLCSPRCLSLSSLVSQGNSPWLSFWNRFPSSSTHTSPLQRGGSVTLMRMAL